MAPKNGSHYTAVDPPPKVVLRDFGPTRTRQSEAAATNINTIVKQYDRTGMLPQVGREGLFLDVSEMPDYRTSLDLITQADKMFMQLPADVRAKFNNEAAVFLDFTSGPENRDEMIEMGLLPKPKVEAEPTSAEKLAKRELARLEREDALQKLKDGSE